MDDVGRRRCVIHDKRGERTKQNAGHKLKHKMRICKENVGGFRYEPRGDWFSFAKVRKRSFSEAHARRLRHPPERFPSTTVSGSDNLFNYIWNMDIYLTKPMDSLQEAFIHPPELREGCFITDARTLFHVFWTVDNKHPLTPLKVLEGTGQCFI